MLPLLHPPMSQLNNLIFVITMTLGTKPYGFNYLSATILPQFCDKSNISATCFFVMSSALTFIDGLNDISSHLNEIIESLSMSDLIVFIVAICITGLTPVTSPSCEDWSNLRSIE